MAIKIRNWSKLQHFKDRSPPWVKLYKDILDDPDWHELDGDVSKTLISLWLIASEDPNRNGGLPDTRKLAFRLRLSEVKLNQHLNKLSQWLEHDDIKSISSRYQADAPETETETETETESELSAIKIADYLAQKIKTENNKTNPNPKTWIGDIEKTIRIDGRSEQDLISIIEWMYTGEKFWAGVVLSGKKLRDKFDTMIVQKNRKSNKPEEASQPIYEEI